MRFDPILTRPDHSLAPMFGLSWSILVWNFVMIVRFGQSGLSKHFWHFN